MDFIEDGIDKIDLNDNKNECHTEVSTDGADIPDNNIHPQLLQKPELKRCYNRDEAFELGLPELPEGAEGDNTSWVQMGEQDVMNMFVDLVDFKDGTDKIDWEKIDYEIYGEDYYRMKFPHFPDEWYALLVQASKEKFKDLTKEKDENSLKIEQGNFTVSFNN